MKDAVASRRRRGVAGVSLTFICLYCLLLQAVPCASQGLLGDLGKIINDAVDRGVDAAADLTTTVAEEAVRQGGMDPSDMPDDMREGVRDIARSMLDPRPDQSGDALQRGLGKITSSLVNETAAGGAPRTSGSGHPYPQPVTAGSVDGSSTSTALRRVSSPDGSFSLLCPADWRSETSTYGGGKYNRVTYVSPCGSAQIKVDSGPGSNSPDPLSDWRDMDRRFRKRYGADYQLLSLDHAWLSGHRAGYWEFVLTRDGEQWHKVDVGADIGGVGYAVLCEARPWAVDAHTEVFLQAMDSFEVTRQGQADQVSVPPASPLDSSRARPSGEPGAGTVVSGHMTPPVVASGARLSGVSRHPRPGPGGGLLGFIAGAMVSLAILGIALGAGRLRRRKDANGSTVS